MRSNPIAMTWRAFICAVVVELAAPAMAIADSAHFDIIPQPLPAALKEFASQAKMQVLYQYDAVVGLDGNAVSGELEKRAALAQLLRNTGLEVVYTSERSATIRKMQEGARSGNADSLSVKPGDASLRVADAAGATDPATAGDQNGAAAAGSSQEPKLEEVVVTAQRREEKLQNVPIALSVLKGADLDRSSLSVDEMLNTVPGVQVLSTGEFGTTSVTIRGVPNPVLQTGASPVAYYVDSVPFGLIKSGLAPDMSAYDLNRVEVLRGPQGTLYGASALNGVVRVLTNDADFSRYDFKVRASSSGTDGGGSNYRGDAAVNMPIVDGKLAARAVVGYQHDSGWIDTPNKNNANDERIANYRLKVNARPTDEFSIDLSAWRSRDNMGAPPLADENQHTSTPEAEPIYNDFDSYGAKLGYRFAHLSITSSTSYIDYKNEGLLDFSQQFGLAGGSFPGLYTRDRSDVFSEEVNLTSNDLAGWRWTAGGIYRRGTEKLRQAVDATSPPSPFPLAFDIQINDLSKSYAVFGEVTRIFSDGRWELTAGLRHFHDDISQESRADSTTPFLPASSTASATTPRLVLAWHPSTAHSVYGSYSEGFRSGFPQNSYAVPVGFPPLQPDKLKNYELGAKGGWLNGSISYDTAVYYMDWHDTQQNLGVPFHGSYASALVNSQSASGVGVDFSLVIRPSANMRFGLTGSWNDLAFDADLFSNGILLFQKGERLSDSPKTTVGAWADYVFPIGSGGYNARVAASANAVSSLQSRFLLDKVYTFNGERMLLTQASFAIDAPLHWTLSVYADNLTNERDSQSPVPWPDFFPRVRPRTVGLQVTYALGHQ